MVAELTLATENEPSELSSEQTQISNALFLGGTLYGLRKLSRNFLLKLAASLRITQS